MTPSPSPLPGNSDTHSLPPPPRTWVFWVSMVLLALASVYLLRAALLPFVAGAAVAYFLDPVADWLERHGLSRLVATILITLSCAFEIPTVPISPRLTHRVRMRFRVHTTGIAE